MSLHVIDHPLIQHKLTFIRDEKTEPKYFRDLLNEVAMLMGYEVTRNLKTKAVMTKTPIAEAKTYIIEGKDVAIVPILRAGLGMLDGLLSLIPTARVGHIGIYRDEETKKPIKYYCKLPKDIKERTVIVVDPMLATGGSVAEGIRLLKAEGCSDIRLMSLIASPEGLKNMRELYPDVDIYVAAIDDSLDENAYIVPGLGDAGDRLFGTK
ncbi:MAG: uracil phosphoribosyltransferase [Clostridia bacterium]